MAITVADLGRGHEFTGKLLRVLAEDGLKDEVPGILVNDKMSRHIAIQFLNTLIGSLDTIPSYQRARDILGQDFISPQEIAKARDINYTKGQLIQLEETLPGKEVLQWARDNGFAVVAGPPSEMNLLDIYKLWGNLFRSKNNPWFRSDDQEFAISETVNREWLVIRKEPVPNSIGRTWGEQIALLSDNERVPNTAEATWFFTVYEMVRDILLIPKMYMRTSSLHSSSRGDHHVSIGEFDEMDFDVSNFQTDGDHINNLGLASALK